jgi:hypothetical protein
MFVLIPRVGPDNRLGSNAVGEWNRAIGQLGADGDQFLADPRQAKVGDFERPIFGYEQIAGLDVTMTLQPLARCMLHSQTELVPEPHRLGHVEPGGTDPPCQVASLHELEDHVRPAFDDLDRVCPHDVAMLAKLNPEPALSGKPADADPAAQKLVAQGLERNHATAPHALVVVDHVDNAHASLVDVEDLESASNPVSDGNNARHGD